PLLRRERTRSSGAEQRSGQLVAEEEQMDEGPARVDGSERRDRGREERAAVHAPGTDRPRRGDQEPGHRDPDEDGPGRAEGAAERAGQDEERRGDGAERRERK